MEGDPDVPVSVVLDSAGRRRSPATLAGCHAGRPPRNKGMLYPADPPTVEEIVCVMRHASENPQAWLPASAEPDTAQASLQHDPERYVHGCEAPLTSEAQNQDG
jgi:hypothetical protein